MLWRAGPKSQMMAKLMVTEYGKISSSHTSATRELLQAIKDHLQESVADLSQSRGKGVGVRRLGSEQTSPKSQSHTCSLLMPRPAMRGSHCLPKPTPIGLSAALAESRLLSSGSSAPSVTRCRWAVSLASAPCSLRRNEACASRESQEAPWHCVDTFQIFSEIACRRPYLPRNATGDGTKLPRGGQRPE